MVDINLFKDEDEEEKEMGPSSGGGEFEEPDLDDALDFGGDLVDFEEGEQAPVLDGGEGLLDIDDAPPEIDGSEDLDKELDYEYGQIEKKRTPVWFWIFLAAVVIGVFVYLFVLAPYLAQRQLASNKKILSGQVKQPVQQQSTEQLQPTDQQQPADQTQPSEQQGEKPAEETEDIVPSVVQASGLQGRQEIGSEKVFSDAAIKIVQDLSRSEQFGTLLISGPDFIAVQYVSATPKVAGAMEYRIKTLMGLQSVKVSPEERVRLSAGVFYFGVVSGRLNTGQPTSTARSGSTYTTASQFSSGVSAFLTKQGCKVVGIIKLVERPIGGKQQVDFRVKATGTQAQVRALLSNLTSLGSNAFIMKLILAPSHNTDFKAENLKVVLEYRLILP